MKSKLVGVIVFHPDAGEYLEYRGRIVTETQDGRVVGEGSVRGDWLTVYIAIDDLWRHDEELLNYMRTIER